MTKHANFSEKYLCFINDLGSPYGIQSDGGGSLPSFANGSFSNRFAQASEHRNADRFKAAIGGTIGRTGTPHERNMGVDTF